MRRASQAARTACLLLLLVFVAACAGVGGVVDPLPSWREGAARSAILRFVAAVTDPQSPDYVPPADRIAAFDNDGTLMVEKPFYFQLYFVVERIRALAPLHPEWKDRRPFSAVIDGDGSPPPDLTLGELEELVLAASAEITEKAYVDAIERFFAEATHPDLGVRFPQAVYPPMVELLEYLRLRGFKTYVCSAAGPEMIRSFSEAAYGVPRENVIGSDMMMRFESDEGTPTLMRELAFVPPTNDRGGKAVNLERIVGRSPILAFGNSDGDIEMLEFTAYSGRPHLGLLLRHDDAEREYAYTEGAEDALAKAAERGWVVVSMKEAFRSVLPEGLPAPPGALRSVPRTEAPAPGEARP